MPQKRNTRQQRETSAQLIKQWEKEKGRKVGLTPEEIESWNKYNKKHGLREQNRLSRYNIYNTYTTPILK